MLQEVHSLQRESVSRRGIIGISIFFALIPLVITAFFLTEGFTRAPFTNPIGDAVNSYYSALKDHNYAQAYTYIDHNQTYASIVPGAEDGNASQKHISLLSFTQSVKRTEQQKGTLTDYQTPSMEWNDKDGTCAVHLTRNGKFYYYILILNLEAGQWKIVNITSSQYPTSVVDNNE